MSYKGDNMTEIETMQRAKMYVDKLANGINPLTDQPVCATDCINQVRISRCLFYVSDILRRVIENGGSIGKAEKSKKQPFAISHDVLKERRPLLDHLKDALEKAGFMLKPRNLDEVYRKIVETGKDKYLRESLDSPAKLKTTLL